MGDLSGKYFSDFSQGQDKVYFRKFYKNYKQVSKALNNLQNNESLSFKV